jgi:hypothetical protein
VTKIRELEPIEFNPAIPIPILPDGWFYEPDPDPDMGGTFTCIEVEDSNPLSREKLWAYCELYMSLDCWDYELRLFVFDRYGLNERQLNLCDLYFTGIVEMARQRREASGNCDAGFDEMVRKWREGPPL